MHMLQCMSPLVALSGHRFGRRACPFLGVKQTSLVRDRVSVNDPRVDLEETARVFDLPC